MVSSNKIFEIKNWLNKEKIKSKVIFRGQEEDQNEARDFLTKAFFIAVFLITIILIAIFNSYYYCLIILTAIIFSTIGVMIGLLISEQPFGIIMSGIGVIALAGIVVNNNIVLLDTYKQLRKNGEDIKIEYNKNRGTKIKACSFNNSNDIFWISSNGFRFKY